MSAQALIELVEDQWSEIAEGITLDGAENLRLVSVDTPVAADPDFARESQIVLAADVAEGATVVQFSPRKLRSIVVRQVTPKGVFAEMLTGGEASSELPVGGVLQETTGEAFVRFVVEGFEHIIPKDLITSCLFWASFSLLWLGRRSCGR